MFLKGSFTIFFENPFWVGLLEREHEGQYEVARYVFGAEPSNAQILDFLLNHYEKFQFNRKVKMDEEIKVSKKSYKKKLNEAKKQLESGCSKKSLEIIQAERKARAKENKREKSLKRIKYSKESFRIKQEKKKNKKKGH